MTYELEGSTRKCSRKQYALIGDVMGIMTVGFVILFLGFLGVTS